MTAEPDSCHTLHVGDQVTPETSEATAAQLEACLADANRAVVFANVRAEARVRIEPAWTDLATGERFPWSWVAEIRVRRASGFVAIMMEVAEYALDPVAWVELLVAELRAAVGRRW